MQSKGIGPKQMNWELNKPQTGIREGNTYYKATA